MLYERESGFRPEEKEGKNQSTLEFAAGSIVKESTNERVNQDTVLAERASAAFGVFDGMGGHKAGEVASTLAAEAVKLRLAEIPTTGVSPEDMSEYASQVRQSLVEADRQVRAQAEKKPEFAGMGTTATVCKVVETSGGEKFALIGHVGDSRLYRFSADGNREQITSDHNVIELLKKGNAISDEAEAERLQKVLDSAETQSDLREHDLGQLVWERRNVLSKAVGAGLEDKDVQVDMIRLKAGDVLLITSDGVTDNLSQREIDEILNTEEDAESIKTELLSRAHDQAKSSGSGHFRAKADDISGVVVKA